MEIIQTKSHVAYQDSICSTSDLPKDYHSYKTENGRTYHAFKEGSTQAAPMTSIDGNQN